MGKETGLCYKNMSHSLSHIYYLCTNCRQTEPVSIFENDTV